MLYKLFNPFTAVLLQFKKKINSLPYESIKYFSLSFSFIGLNIGLQPMLRLPMAGRGVM